MQKESLKVWRKGNMIMIKVISSYIYEAEILSVKSLNSWLRHLREKRWWGDSTEQKFLREANAILNKKYG